MSFTRVLLACVLFAVLCSLFVVCGQSTNNAAKQRMKRCRRNYQCVNQTCCAGWCKDSCVGTRCLPLWYSHCGRDRAMKCCHRQCERTDSCLGYSCTQDHDCGFHKGRQMRCCAGTCRSTCYGTPCHSYRECGSNGRGKCCNGVCKRSCHGSFCFEREDCYGLACCGYFGEKTCRRSCLGHNCTVDSDCHSRWSNRIVCCGNEKCQHHCEGSVCSTETFSEDCDGKFCCGIGQKRCRSSCNGVPCRKKSDCGTSNYICTSQLPVARVRAQTYCTDSWGTIIRPLQGR